MYLRNRGDIDAVFSIDAIVKVSHDTGDKELFGLQNFNALFSVPGIITVGPNFKLLGSVDMDASISGHIEVAVKNLKDPDSTTQSGTTTFDCFGITWAAVFNKLPNCEVDLVVDGYATVYLKASTTTTSVCYGVNTGANLFAQLDAPSQLNWVLPASPWVLGESSAPIVPETCPISASARDVETLSIEPPGLRARPAAALARDGLEKRGRKVYMYTTSTGITINLDTATFPNCGAAIANRPQNYFWNYIARGLGDGVNNCRPCARQQQNESPEGNILQDAESVSRLGLAGRHYDLSLPSSPISPTSPPRLRTRRQFGTSSSV
ncbi:hypothetical protein F4824DRAFT_506075 [Ustulina deusta]|nr:hypothetical protein F4824DRAFT_506075 [Ustulina deusta]